MSRVLNSHYFRFQQRVAMKPVTVSLANIVTFFEDEIKLIGRGENTFKSTRVEQFIFDGSTGIIRDKVRSSLKDIVYSVELPISMELLG